jgi:hypothetical protein
LALRCSAFHVRNKIGAEPGWASYAGDGRPVSDSTSRLDEICARLRIRNAAGFGACRLCDRASGCHRRRQDESCTSADHRSRTARDHRLTAQARSGTYPALPTRSLGATPRRMGVGSSPLLTARSTSPTQHQHGPGPDRPHLCDLSGTGSARSRHNSPVGGDC